MVTCSHVKVFSTSLVNFWQPLLFYIKNISFYFEVVGGSVPFLKTLIDILSQIYYLFDPILCSYDSINPSSITSMCRFGIKHCPLCSFLLHFSTATMRHPRKFSTSESFLSKQWKVLTSIKP